MTPVPAWTSSLGATCVGQRGRGRGLSRAGAGCDEDENGGEGSDGVAGGAGSDAQGYDADVGAEDEADDEEAAMTLLDGGCCV